MVTALEEDVLEELADLLSVHALDNLLVVGVEVEAIAVVAVHDATPVAIGLSIDVGLLQQNLLRLVEVFLVGGGDGGLHALLELGHCLDR